MIHKKINIFYFFMSAIFTVYAIWWAWQEADYSKYAGLYFFQLVFDCLMLFFLFKKKEIVKYFVALQALLTSLVWIPGQIIFFLVSLSSFFPIYALALNWINGQHYITLAMYYVIIALWILLSWINVYIFFKHPLPRRVK